MKWPLRWVGVGALLVTAGLVAPQVAAGDGTVADWTVLVYAAHDNNLETSLYGDLVEMGKHSGRVNFVVYVDRAIDEQPPLDEDWLGLAKFSDTKVFKVTGDGVSDVQELGETYSMDPSSLAWFIGDSLARYPAHQTMLVMSDHGGGPVAAFGTKESDTEEGDAKARNTLQLPAIAAAIKSGLATAGKERFNALLWATCLNGNFEVARVMAPHFDYMVASQEIILGSASAGVFDFDFSVDPPAASPPSKADTLKYLTSLVEGKDDLYRNGPLPNEDFTTSIYDLSLISTLNAALGNFVRATKDSNGVSFVQEARAAGVLEFAGGGITEGQNQPGFGLIDMGDLLARIPATAPAPMLAARDALAEANKNARVYMSNGAENQAATGLSIYYPRRSSGVKAVYSQIPDDTGWRSIIASPKATLTSSSPDSALEVLSKAAGWKSTLIYGKQISRSWGATAVYGTQTEKGIRQIISPRVVIGAGGKNKAQAAFGHVQFMLGNQVVSAHIDNTGKQVFFDAILVRASTTEQVEVRVVSPLKIAGKKLKPGVVKIMERNGSAVLKAEAGDLLAPVIYYWDSQETAAGGEFILTVAESEVALGVAATSLVTVAPTASGAYAIAMSLYDPAADGDLVIEQGTVTK